MNLNVVRQICFPSTKYPVFWCSRWDDTFLALHVISDMLMWQDIIPSSISIWSPHRRTSSKITVKSILANVWYLLSQSCDASNLMPFGIIAMLHHWIWATADIEGGDPMATITSSLPLHRAWTALLDQVCLFSITPNLFSILATADIVHFGWIVFHCRIHVFDSFSKYIDRIG